MIGDTKNGTVTYFITIKRVVILHFFLPCSFCEVCFNVVNIVGNYNSGTFQPLLFISCGSRIVYLKNLQCLCP